LTRTNLKRSLCHKGNSKVVGARDDLFHLPSLQPVQAIALSIDTISLPGSKLAQGTGISKFLGKTSLLMG
jgi:hypothetical protein